MGDEEKEVMAETKLELNRRVILHKRRKEQLRQQQKLIDVLSRDTSTGYTDEKEMDAGYFYCPYIPIMTSNAAPGVEPTYKTRFNWINPFRKATTIIDGDTTA